MRFGVLGPLAVWTADGDPVTIPGVKVRALLADLLLHDGRPVPADRLIDDLWGDHPPGNPAGALSAKVSQLRRALEDAEPGARELLAARPAGYQLGVEAAAVDARRFQSLVTEARDRDDPRARATLLSDALALWRGPAFADFADDAFARAAIARLEEQRLTAREDQAEARLALGEHTLLADELAEVVREYPLRERLRAAHLRALYRAGRQSEALDGYEELRARLAEELGLDPGAELVALHRAILTQDPSLDAPEARATAARPLTNLPAPITALIGREDAVTEVRAQLGSARLVTLTGPGGVGKTRLALEIAAGLAESYPDGVWLVELAVLDRLGTPDMLGSLIDAVMSALDLRDGGAAGRPMTPLDRLITALRTRRALLVLDNCEHVVDQVAEMTEALLRAVPGLRVLATSQEPLALAGEVVWNVPPLEVPERAAGGDPAALEQSSAVRLFVTRASAAARGFALDAEIAGDVAVLCRRLDGIPLALELAATKVPTLGVHGLVARLDDRFRLLATGHRGAPPRQQTLTAMIDWSWELLTAPERIVLRRLAVHADGCTLEAAEAVCSGDDLPAPAVLDLLARLVGRSLVVAVHGVDGPRYRLLESVAAYCLERMHEAGEFERVRRRHHEHYAELAERAEPCLYGREQRRWLARLDAATPNLRAALDGAVADRHAGCALRMVNALAWYWFLRGRLTEARRSLEAALALDGDAPAALRARATAWHAGIVLLQGGTPDHAAGRDAVLRAYDGVDDPAGRARSEWFLGYAGLDAGDLTAGEELLDRALTGFRAIGDDWGVAAALVTRTKLAHLRGDLAALRRDGERSADLFEVLGDRWGELQASGWLGALAEMTGDYERARHLHTEGLRMAQELALWPEVSGRLAWLGWIALQLGDYKRAREFCEEAVRLAREQGFRPLQIFAEMGLAFAARKDGCLDTAERHLREVLASAPRQEAAQEPPHLAMVLAELGFVAEQRGDAPAARALHLEAFAVADRLGAPREKALALEGLAGALALSECAAPAAQLLGAAAAARASSALPLAPAERGDVDRIEARARHTLGADRFAAEFARGGALAPEEARSVADRACI
ncbi:BTAD domain-containing putative transcriptional regulator [Sphaerisporangium siamense]|uniref:Putative ATPase/DNA-binding SARP family transcriptional activator n=1 Tax=Sphaerisporangium siamense TaxID=795645 RepID=A0A7W7DAS7_9ACTN|nr:BTAD domain-containing putative transcriptional regulator [Sphaerisporangium siamense]MBB4703144.1 putative ATPase/DNA-binding SARP family transcriptional activator [Sphaerisporangium siamense]